MDGITNGAMPRVEPFPILLRQGRYTCSRLNLSIYQTNTSMTTHTTDHSWMPNALSCMAKRFNQRGDNTFEALYYTFYPQQHFNRHNYPERGGYQRIT